MNAKEYIRARTTFKHLGIFDRANIAIHMESYHKHKVETAWISVKDQLPEKDDKILFVHDGIVCFGFYETDKDEGKTKRHENAYYNGFVDVASWHDAYGFQDVYKIEKVSYWQLEPKPIK